MTSEDIIRENLGGFVAETLTLAGLASGTGNSTIEVDGVTPVANVIENNVLDENNEVITPLFVDLGTGSYSITFVGLKTGTKLIVTSLVQQTNSCTCEVVGGNSIRLKTWALSNGAPEDGKGLFSVKQVNI